MPPPKSPSFATLQPCQVQLFLFVQGGPRPSSPTPCAPGPYLAKCSICFASADGCYLALLHQDQDAFAVEGEFGVLEGRTLSLVHPLVMGGLFVYTLWAGYLGWQWRRVQTIQEEINDLKKQGKPAAVTPEDGSPPPEWPPPSPAELKIQQLIEERKELIKSSFSDRHFNEGSILLGFGVLESVGGGVNTWFRTGKLFPGPHLFVGAGITVLWPLAAAVVPATQKGNDTARSLHIALNLLNVMFFVWQIPTGIDVVFTKCAASPSGLDLYKKRRPLLIHALLVPGSPDGTKRVESASYISYSDIFV